jgi:hypothetical protein
LKSTLFKIEQVCVWTVALSAVAHVAMVDCEPAELMRISFTVT